MNESIIDEIRKTRDAYAARFNYDVKAMMADIRKRQKKSGHKLVSFARRRKKAA